MKGGILAHPSIQAGRSRSCILRSVLIKYLHGDGVRHNRPPRADDSYQLTKENSIVRDILTISLGAIAGANARYFLSRYAAKVMGPVFPYGTLVINVTGSIDRRLLHDLGHRAGVG